MTNTMDSALPEPCCLSRRMLEQTADAVVLIGRDLAIRHWTRGVASRLECDTAELNGAHLLSLVHPDEREAVRHRFETAFRENRIQLQTRVRMRCKAGLWREIEAVGANCLEDPYLRAMVVTLRDRTGEQAAESALHEAARNLELAVEASNTGLWIWDLQSNRVSFNAQWKAQLGHGEEDLPDRYQSWEERLHPDDRDPVLERIGRAIADPAYRYEVEFRMRHRNGTWRWIYARGTVERDASGAPLVIRGSHVDITAHKEMEEALRVREEAASQLIEEAPDGVLLLGPEGRILATNSRACTISGWSREELVGMSIAETFLPEERETVGDYLRVLREGPPIEIERRLLRKDGTTVQVESTAKLLPDSRIVSIMRDVSARREREERIRQAQKLESLGQLTGGIAHDLNNVLTVILANAEYVGSALPDRADLTIVLKDILDAANRGAALIRRLTGFARTGVLQPQPVRLDAWLHDFQRTLRRLLPATIRIQPAITSGVPPIQVDPTALEQIMLNLATNARDAMPAGGILTIAGSTESGTETEPAPCVIVRVTDSGEGMDPATISRVFEPFFTTKPPGKGTGLGLSTVYGLMKQHGGSVSVESAPGKGTAITLRFPVAGMVEEPLPEVTNAPIPVVAATALLVEDDDLLRETARRALVLHGFEVLLARNGAEGLRILETEGDRVDLVITDVVMPVLGGIGLYHETRIRGYRLPFLFTSGHAPDDAVFPDAAPDVLVLPKPWTIDALAAKAQRLIGGKGR